MHLLVNVLNIRKYMVCIDVKFLLLDIILLIMPKEEINLWGSTLYYFLRLLVILALMIMLIALCYVTLHYIRLHYEFSGPVCLPSSDHNQMESSRQASGRNELLQFAYRCNNLLELSLGASPSPLLPDIPHPHIFFMTSGMACSSTLFTYIVFFCDSRILSHPGCYGNVSTRHTVHYITSVLTCQIVAIL